MIYLGSKNRIAKHILPIMLKEAESKGITTWIEPFVGGGNMIDKVPKSFKKIGSDYNPHAIQALIAIRDYVDDLPDELTREDYNKLKKTEPNPITSWLRFVCSFGAKFENTYASNKTSDATTYAGAGKRNAQKQSPNLQDVVLVTCGYDELLIPNNSLIYCDPPYQGTTSYKTGSFDHSNFWEWCREMSENNTVFISEYNAPVDFTCIWSGEIKTNFAANRTSATHKAVEKLFIYNKEQKI